MKKLLLLVCALVCTAVAYSQTVLKAKLPLGQVSGSVPVYQKSKDTAKAVNVINALNQAIQSFNSHPNSSTFQSMCLLVKDTALKDIPQVKALSQALSAVSDTSIDSLAKQPVDTIAKTTPVKDSLLARVCPKLVSMGLKYLVYNDGFLGVLTDTSDNAIASFVLQQDNKELFYDKLRKSLNGICEDTCIVNTIVRSYRGQDPDLYTRFLEAKADLANTNGLAGKLYIYRDVAVYGSEMIDEVDNVDEDEQYSVAYPNFKSIRKARRVANRAYKKVRKLQVKLDSLTVRIGREAKEPSELVLAKRVKNIKKEVDSMIMTGMLQLDAIDGKMPEYKIIQYYNRAIQLFRMVDLKARRAKRIMQYEKVPKATTMILHGSSSGGSAYVPALAIPFLPQLGGAPGMDGAGGGLTGFADTSVRPASNFIIQSVKIQFQDGFIENILILGRRRGGRYLYKFENTYPIGFSTKRDFRNMVDVRLYEKSDHHRYGRMYLVLGEVLRYDENFANYSKDFSPANQVLPVDAITDSIKEIALYKDQTSKILELRVFSDLKGTDETNPNGLIQLELNKRLNLFSRRWPLSFRGKDLEKYEPIANRGWFNFVTPQFSINKIENNQKRLLLDQIDTLTLAADTSKPISYASTINLLRHQIYKVGFDLSVFLVDMPNLKSTIEFGVGVYFGRSALQDSVRKRLDTGQAPHVEFVTIDGGKANDYGVNTFQWGPYFSWQIFPDSRFGIVGTQRFAWYKALTNNFVQVRDSAHYLKYIANTPREDIARIGYDYYNYKRTNDWFVRHIAERVGLFTKCIASSEIFAYWNPNPDGANKIFFRYRLNWDLANPRENYHQIQVGFSTYLTATKEFSKLKKSSGVDF